jgi:septum site-determining protein MinD
MNHEKGFDVIAASLTPKKIDPLKLKKHINFLRNQYDYILIDTSPSLNEELLGAMMAADELLVVSSPDYPTLSCTIHAIKVARKRGTPITGMILNKVRDKKFELQREEIEKATETPVIALIPDDVKIAEALAFARPAAVHAPLSNAVVEYKKLGAAMIGEHFDDPRLLARLKGFLFKEDEVVEQNRAQLHNKNR